MGGYHKREAEVHDKHAPAIAHHPYGGISYTDRSPQGLHKRSADAEASYGYGYKPSYGYGYHKRSADAEASYGYAHHGYGYGYKPSYGYGYHKRSADASHGYGYGYKPSYGYGHYGYGYHQIIPKRVLVKCETVKRVRKGRVKGFRGGLDHIVASFRVQDSVENLGFKLL